MIFTKTNTGNLLIGLCLINMGDVIGFVLLIWYHIFLIVFIGSILVLSFSQITKREITGLKQFSLIFIILIVLYFFYLFYFDYNQNNLGFMNQLNLFRERSIFASAYIFIISILFTYLLSFKKNVS